MLSSFCSTIAIKESVFQNNHAVSYRGVLISFDSVIIMQSSRLQDINKLIIVPIQEEY